MRWEARCPHRAYWSPDYHEAGCPRLHAPQYRRARSGALSLQARAGSMAASRLLIALARRRGLSILIRLGRILSSLGISEIAASYRLSEDAEDIFDTDDRRKQALLNDSASPAAVIFIGDI